MTGYVVVTNQRTKRGDGNTRELLFRKHPDGSMGQGTNYYVPTRNYWTDDIIDAWIMCKSDADEICGKLRHNNPRVVPIDTARATINKLRGTP